MRQNGALSLKVVSLLVHRDCPHTLPCMRIHCHVHTHQVMYDASLRPRHTLVLLFVYIYCMYKLDTVDSLQYYRILRAGTIQWGEASSLSSTKKRQNMDCASANSSVYLCRSRSV